MSFGKYFNKGVMALDSPHIGHVVRETKDKIVVFGEGKERYDIPISEIQTTGRNILIGLSIYDIARKYKVDREGPLPTDQIMPRWDLPRRISLAAYEGKYPKSLFNKGVRIQNEDHVGHIMLETNDKIVIFGDYNLRFDVPKSQIYEVGRNVILNMDWDGLMKYKVNRNAPLPTGEPISPIPDKGEQIAAMNQSSTGAVIQTTA